MKFKALAVTCAAAFLHTVASAGPSWIDWTTMDTGTLTIGSTVVGVSMTGSSPLSLNDGDYYYNNGSTGGVAPTGTYGGYQPSESVGFGPLGARPVAHESAVPTSNTTSAAGMPHLGFTPPK